MLQAGASKAAIEAAASEEKCSLRVQQGQVQRTTEGSTPGLLYTDPLTCTLNTKIEPEPVRNIPSCHCLACSSRSLCWQSLILSQLAQVKCFTKQGIAEWIGDQNSHCRALPCECLLSVCCLSSALHLNVSSSKTSSFLYPQSKSGASLVIL